MTLAQIFAWCNQKSYFSRDEEEIWGAINTAALQLYTEILNENRGYFWVWDTTSMTLVANTEEYALPAAAENLVRMRERLSASDPWRIVSPADVNSETVTSAQFASVLGASVDSELSEFVYVGPYQAMAEAQAGTFIKKIKIEPIPLDGPRFVELLYTAKHIEIMGQESQLIIDPPGHNALKYLATAELLAAQDDDNCERFETKGDTHKTQYLKLVRSRQQQKGREVEPYVSDLD